jgi:RNA polymerase sigma-70 factor (ECF subfamily)
MPADEQAGHNPGMAAPLSRNERGPARVWLSMSDSPFDSGRWQQALAHHAQLLALAERLLDDPAGAEDAVHHAMLQESRGLRSSGVPRGRFLSTVVRNFARRLRRDAATRQRHERAAARPESLPASDELAAREQLRRKVADAVLALDEPYRITVALVYLEQLSPAAAAQRLQVAESTVRVRLHRAREQLRRRLDRDFGSRAAWAPLVLRLPQSVVPASAAMLGVLLMKKSLWFAVATVLVLASAALFLRERESVPMQEPAPVASLAPVASPAEPLVRAPAEAPPTLPQAPVVAQQFQCVDERGQPIAGAEVRLVRCPLRADSPVVIANSDGGGLASFEDVAAAHYVIKAHSGHRHFVPDVDHRAVPLPAQPMQLVLRELWIGGLVMPGTEVVKCGWGWGGFMRTADEEPERELEATWKEAHPDAVFWVAVQNPRRAPSDTIDVHVSWFGHRQHRQWVRMWPASLFSGPDVVDPAAVPACVSVVLTAPSGQPLPEAVQVALRERADLYDSSGQRGQGPFMEGIHGFKHGTAKLPVGDYQLRLFDASSSSMRPAAKCSVARDTVELRIPIAIGDRVVKLHLRGLDSAGYMLSIAHESGRKALEFGNPDGEHVLLLPPGTCRATISRVLPDQHDFRQEYVFTVSESVTQEVTWDVPAR